jgi:hypothetical protein
VRAAATRCVSDAASAAISGASSPHSDYPSSTGTTSTWSPAAMEGASETSEQFHVSAARGD